ncbi:unnamed protein product [Sphagnum tenellum]
MDDADAIITALDRHIRGATNTTVTTYELFTTKRQPHEAVDTFAISVRDKASRTGYADLANRELSWTD